MYCPIRRLLQSISYVLFAASQSAIVGRRMNSPLRNRAEWNITSHFFSPPATTQYSPYIRAITTSGRDRPHPLRVFKRCSPPNVAPATSRGAPNVNYGRGIRSESFRAFRSKEISRPDWSMKLPYTWEEKRSHGSIFKENKNILQHIKVRLIYSSENTSRKLKINIVEPGAANYRSSFLLAGSHNLHTL